MNWLNHFLLSFSLLFLILGEKASSGEIIAASAIFGMLLDLDHIAKWLFTKEKRYLRTWVQEPFGFVIIGIPVAIALSILFEPYYFMLVLVPYLSHIILDYLTVNEVSPLAPFSKKRFRLGFIRQFPDSAYSREYKKGVSENYVLAFNILAFAFILQNYSSNGLFLSIREFLPFVSRCFYFMLPAYFANMAPVMVKKIGLFDFPVDFGKKVNGGRVLGSHKTFRGFIFGIAFAVIVAYIQFLLQDVEFFRNLSFFDYDSWLLLGFLMGFGALAGDSIKSFFKRRIGIKPGERFIPFDQIDFVLGVFALTAPFFDVTLKIFAISVLLTFALDILVNHLAFYMKIRSEKW
ncbi:CDP-archaeol synthase [Candidatus Woesearchaeota archaeon]|nr:CDP-archaeol synthase [Candidatus Woesearchaeota archaeon]